MLGRIVYVFQHFLFVLILSKRLFWTDGVYSL